MSKSKQQVTGSKIGGRIRQSSDDAGAEQDVSESEALSVDQRVSSQQDSLILGKYKATGLVAVCGLVLVALIYIAVQYFLKK
jgi:hypothetical protein